MLSEISDKYLSLIRAVLIEWGRANYLQYPWRDIEDPWLALVAEVLLQRTNAQAVANKWDMIVERYSAPEKVLALSEAELARVDRDFGLDRRSRTIRELAELIDSCDYYPMEPEQLEAIHGIGHYTIAAYLSLHMHRRAILLDSNIARLITRVTGVERPSDLRKKSELWTLAERLTPSTDYKTYNYALLDLSMTVCKPRHPACGNCPLAAAGLCALRREG